MRVARAFLREREPSLWWPGAAVFVFGIFFFWLDLMGWLVAPGAATEHAGEYLLDIGLLAVLAGSVLFWRLAWKRGVAPPGSGMGFLLAAFGLICRKYLTFILFDLGASNGWVYGGVSYLEKAADRWGRIDIWGLRWGGLFAYVVGLALVAWSCRKGRPQLPLGKGRGD